MTRLRGTLALGLWATVFTAIGVAQAASTSGAAKMVVIDGSKTPHLIPEHQLWRSGFYTIADLGSHEDTKARLDAIGLSQPELSAVLRVAKGADTRDRECVDAIRRRDADLRAQGLDLKAVYQGHYDVILECRQRILTEKDRLLASLSPEGRAALTNWIDSWRAKTKLTVPAHEAEFFQLPR
jgi:hypothetical protein